MSDLWDSVQILGNQLDELTDEVEDLVKQRAALLLRTSRAELALTRALATILGTANWCEVKGNNRSADFLRQRAGEIAAEATREEEVQQKRESQQQAGLTPEQEPSP